MEKKYTELRKKYTLPTACGKNIAALLWKNTKKKYHRLWPRH